MAAHLSLPTQLRSYPVGAQSIRPRLGTVRVRTVQVRSASDSDSRSTPAETSGQDNLFSVQQVPGSGKQLVASKAAVLEATGGGNGDGARGNGGGGGGGGDGGANEGDDDEFLSLAQAEEIAAAKGVQLPEDFVTAAVSGGLRKSALNSFIRLQAFAIAGWLARVLPAARDRLIFDDRFLFKVLAEIAIDSGCATVAEVRKRGDEFWSEFEFYMSDLCVGLVLDVVLVGLLAPTAVIGAKARGAGATGLQRFLTRFPSAVFQPSVPGGRKFSVGDRAGCLVVKAMEYSLAGMACGCVGQAIANSMMLLRRKYVGSSEHDVEVPPLLRTTLVWGLFMGVSSNVRYQTVFGLERLVDVTVARKLPQIAYVTTILIRFVNNIIGGENFIDMARWAGVQ